MIKHLHLLLAALLLATFATTASANGTLDEASGLYFLFDETAKTATVTYPGDDPNSNPNSYTGDIVVPSTVTYNEEEYTVTTIGTKAFSHSTITSIVIPDGVTRIEGDACAYNNSLLTITVGTGATYMENGLCWGSDNLKNAYLNMTTVPSNASGYPYYMFSSNPNVHVASTIVGGFVTTNNWKDYTYITTYNNITYSVKGTDATVTYPGGIDEPTAAGENSYSEAKSIPASFRSSSKTIYVRAIGKSAFRYATLTSLTIGSNVTSIDQYAFANCTVTGTSGITIPRYVTTIGNYAFHTASVKMLTFNEGLTTIGEHAFEKSSGYTSVQLPNSLTTTGYNAFTECKATSVGLGSGLTNVGQGFFHGSSVKEVYFNTTTVPASRNAYIFPGGTTIYVAPEMIEKFTAITNWARPAVNWTAYKYAIKVEIDGLWYIFNGDEATVSWAQIRTAPVSTATAYYPASEITIPTTVTYDGKTYNVTEVGANAFAYSKITAVSMPEGIKTIGSGAFTRSTALTSVEVPNSVTVINSDAFAYINTLQTIIIGANVAKCNQGISYNNSSARKLANVYIKTTSVPTGASYLFSYVSSGAFAIHVYKGMADLFKAASNWSSYSSFYVEDLEDYLYAAVQSKYADLEGIKGGADPGLVTEESYAANEAALHNALAKAEAVTATSTGTDIDEALTDMKKVEQSLEINPITAGYYYIVSAGKGAGDDNGDYNFEDKFALYTSGSSTATWFLYWKEYDKADATQIYYLEPNGTNWNVYSPMHGTYIQYPASTANGANAKTNTSAYPQLFTSAGKGAGKFVFKYYTTSYKAYALAAGNNGPAATETSGQIKAYGTADDAIQYGVNTWYLHRVPTADAEQIFETAIANINDDATSCKALVLPAGESGGTNLVVKDGSDYTCEKLSLTDKGDYALYPYTRPAALKPTNFTATNLVAERQFYAGLNTVCLPYAISTEDLGVEGAKIYKFSELKDGNTTLSFTEVETADADDICLVELPEGTPTKTYAFSFENKPVITASSHATSGYLFADFVKYTADSDGEFYKLTADNTFAKAKKGAVLYPYRWGLYTEDLPAATGSNIFSISLSEDDDLTAIDPAANNESAATIAAIYGEDGVKRASLQKGLNVVKFDNGQTQKIFIK